MLAVVFWFAVIPSPPYGMTAINDKVAHFLVFLGFGISAFFIWPYQTIVPKILLLLGVYGATIELVQHFVPGRTLSLFDWIMDIAGLIVAFGLIKIKPATFKIYGV